LEIYALSALFEKKMSARRHFDETFERLPSHVRMAYSCWRKIFPIRISRTRCWLNLLENFPSARNIKLVGPKDLLAEFWFYVVLSRSDKMYRLRSTARIITLLSFAAVCAIGAAAQSQPDSQAGAQLGEQSALAGKEAQGANTQKTTETSPNEVTAFVAGTLINAELASSLDSKKVKSGDAVNARTATDLKSTDGRIILPKGTKIIGHVTQASARNAGQPDSSLGLVFDKAILKSGQEIPLNAAGVQAVGAPASSSFDTNQTPAGEPATGSRSAPGNGGQATSRGGGGMGGSPSAPASAPGRTDDPYGGANPPDPGNANAGRWDANTRGVVGLRNLSLDTAAGGNGQGSVITSTGKNVHLDSGTRLLLVTGAVASH
jgi:hypothetical protein